MRLINRRNTKVISGKFSGHFKWVNSARNLAARSRMGRLVLNHRRITAGGLAGLIIVSLIIQIVQPFAAQEKYILTSSVRNLIGDSRDDINQNLNLDSSKSAYEFKLSDAPVGMAGASEHGGRNDNTYSTRLPLSAKQGITYTDTSSQISISVAPKFSTGAGRKVDGGHIVYPSGSSQLVYTHKYNGLKEDIIVPKFSKEKLSYNFEMRLPTGVEARLEPSGTIGIYSADPTLYGNITYGADSDRAKVDKARASSPKTNLVVTIPAPIVKDGKGREHTDKASFSLSSKSTKQIDEVPVNLPAEVREKTKHKTTKNIYTLGLDANQLQSLAYPISIDPTIQSSSASDFAKGNLDGMTELDTDNALIKRAGLTGGAIDGWVNNPINSPFTGSTDTAVYNNKLYVAQVGAPAQFADINSSTGSVGSFTSTGATLSTAGGRLATYYDHMFYLSTGASRNSHVSARIKTDGTLGPVTSTGSNSLSGRNQPGATIYNGYVYIVGGRSTSGTGELLDPIVHTFHNTVQYAKVNADGSFGAWATTSPITVSREAMEVYGYNGYLYAVGGNTESNSFSTVEFAKVNPDGTVGQWIAQTSMPLPRFNHGSFIHKGYMYSLGGWVGTSNSDYSSVVYASVNADGTIGAWDTTSSFTTARKSAGFLSHNGYLYLAGGNSGLSPSVTNYNDIQYAKIKPPGTVISGPAVPNYPTARWGGATIVDRGYIYVMGGCTVAPTYVINALQPCPAANIAGNGQNAGAVQGTSPDRLDIKFAKLKADGAIDTTYTLAGYTPTNGWFTDKASCTEGLPTAPHECPGARYAFAVVVRSHNVYIISGRGGDNAGSSNGNNLTADVNKLTISSNGAPFTWFSALENDCQLGDNGSTVNTPREFATANSLQDNYDEIYLSGGRNNIGTVLTSTEQLSADRCNWTQVAVLPAARWQAATFAYGGNIYILGGRGTGSTVYGDIIKTNNNVSSWTTVCSTCNGLPALYGASAYAYKGKVYVVGGVTNGTDPPTAYSSTIYTASIDTSGNIGTFTSSSVSLSGGHYLGGASMSADAEVFYVAGGVGSSGNNAGVDTFRSREGGSGGITWATTGNSDTGTLRAGHATATYNNYVYLVGGFNGTSYLNSVQMGTIDPATGNVSWTTEATLPTTLAYGGAFVANGYLYAVGGRINSSTGPNITNKIYRAPINPVTGRTTGGFVDMDTINPSGVMHLGVARERFGMGVAQGYLYVLAGVTWEGGTETQTASYEYASINADGTLGPVGASGTVFTTSAGMAGWGRRSNIKVTDYNGRLYVSLGEVGIITGCGVGGNSACHYHATGEVLEVNPDRTLKKVGQLNPATTGPGGGVIALNGYLYLIGGNGLPALNTTNGATSYVQVSPINTSSVVADRTWQFTNYITGGGRTAASYVTYGGRIYIVGGCNNIRTVVETGGLLNRSVCDSGFLSTEVHGSLNSIARTGTYSRLLDFEKGVRPTKLIIRGSKRAESTVGLNYSTSNNNSSLLNNSQVIADAAYGGNVPIVLSLGSGRTLSRYLWLQYTLDDSKTAVFEDIGYQTTLTDYDVYYDPNPGSRLRGGRTFTNGLDRGLQVNP